MKFPDWNRLRADAASRGRRLLTSGRSRFHTSRAWVSANDPVWKAWRRPGRAETISGAVAGVLVLAVVLTLALFDWNHLRGPIGRWASDKYERDISIDGDLDVTLFGWTPSVAVEDLRIGGPDWADEDDTLRVGRFEGSARLQRLLAGQLELTRAVVIEPEIVLIVHEDGRRSWVMDDTGPDEPTRLPLIERLLIRDGRVRVDERGRGLTLDAAIDARELAEGVGDEDERSGFRLEGEGALNGQPLTLRVLGEPFVQLRRDRPWRFRAELTGAGSELEARGQITRPFDLSHFTADLSLSGPDLANLYLITGVVTPNTPPYSLEGDLARDDSLWTFNEVTGRVGDSDLSGDVSVDRVDDRLRVEADLRSRSLDLDDLFAVLGAPPDPTETASPEQRARAGAMRAQARLLPDAPLRTERLRTMDGRLDFRADEVKHNDLAVTAVSLGAALEDGILGLDPIAFAFAQGELNGTARIDATGDVPQSTVDLRLAGYPLEAVIPARDGQPTVTGRALGRVRLQGPGASIADFAARSRGTITVVVPQGQMREAFAELLGINVGRGLRLLLSDDQRTTPIRCAVASFDVRDGIGTASTFIIDTDVVLAQGEGTLNLRNERLDIRIDGESKKPRLLRVWSPITVSGPIRSPSVGVDEAAIAGQVGLIAAIGALVAPVAGVLGLIEPGLAEDANCGALISQAR
ncbi:AsmA family protein [Brevundimonas sp. BAL450]|uniref:AsmA family protein n=1 Tax=Brevundimonas sp. BAL450 TaxID=1708162 RepID=UPI00351C0145